MSTPAIPNEAGRQTGGRSNRWLYLAVGAVVVVLLIIGLVTYSGNKETREAQEKAQELTERLQEAGLRVPQDQDIIVRSLGSDGGAICANPANALGKALLNSALVNGASFVGQRPVIVPRNVVQGELIILDVYCPDKVEDYRDKIDDLKFDDTIKS